MSDATLVVAITRGNKPAFDEAYLRCGNSVHTIARRLCGNTRAEDLVQDIFLDLWRRPERFDPDRGSLGAFLSVQAHGRSIDLLRSDGARRARERADLAAPAAPGRSTETTAMGRVDRDDLDAALAQLPATEREVIVMAYFGGHTYAEVARMLGQPLGTVKSRIRTGLVRLRALFDDGGIEGPVLAA